APSAYLLRAAQSRPLRPAVSSSAFLGATVLPAYGAFLMPEIFNFALVLLAYFLWLYKEVKPESAMARPWSDIAAAVVLGIATYSKPMPTPVLVAPPVILASTRRRCLR